MLSFLCLVNLWSIDYITGYFWGTDYFAPLRKTMREPCNYVKQCFPFFDTWPTPFRREQRKSTTWPAAPRAIYTIQVSSTEYVATPIHCRTLIYL
uniref:Macaca fascicularis brain cDNA, clone: QflA-23176 n=1 Tax=Macaca fascicularis TaxID=9541 RepID=I7G7M7_MACFA|nr:unnamed protein product [Macaca fascicularis]